MHIILNAMEEFLLNIINFNEDVVNYPFIFTSVFVYVFLLWVAVSVWVLADARKRYRNVLMHFVIFFFILFFNLPALIFYLLIRPDFTFEEEELLEATLYNNRKIDPIIFSGDQGFDINLNVRVTPRRQDEKGVHEIDVDVAWVPTDPAPTVENIKEYEQLKDKLPDELLLQEDSVETGEEKRLPFEDFFSAIASRTSEFFSGINKKMKQLTKPKPDVDNDESMLPANVAEDDEDGTDAYDDEDTLMNEELNKQVHNSPEENNKRKKKKKKKKSKR